MTRIYRHNKSTELGGFGTTILLIFFVVAAGGWITNIIKLARMDWDAALGIEGILRIVGIIAAPLGVVMGFI